MRQQRKLPDHTTGRDNLHSPIPPLGEHVRGDVGNQEINGERLLKRDQAHRLPAFAFFVGRYLLPIFTQGIEQGVLFPQWFFGIFAQLNLARSSPGRGFPLGAKYFRVALASHINLRPVATAIRSNRSHA